MQGWRIVRYQGAGFRQVVQMRATSHVPVESTPLNAFPFLSVSIEKSSTVPYGMSIA